MFHKVKVVNALQDFRLSVQFAEKAFENNSELFSGVGVDVGGYGIIWNDDLDLSCDELFANGETIKTPFDGLKPQGLRMNALNAV